MVIKNKFLYIYLNSDLRKKKTQPFPFLPRGCNAECYSVSKCTDLESVITPSPGIFSLNDIHIVKVTEYRHLGIGPLHDPSPPPCMHMNQVSIHVYIINEKLELSYFHPSDALFKLHFLLLMTCYEK